MTRIPVLPTLLTLGNGVCGFAAIAYASKITLGDSMPRHLKDQYFLFSAVLILVAMLFDVLDGYAARLSRTASEFGGQLDSLCDAISFGAAPAFLLLRLGQDWSEHTVVAKLIAVIAALYLACAILRLARFNVENDPDPAAHKRFKGLPSPAAAGCVASLAALRADYTSEWTGLGIDPNFLHGFVQFWAPLGTLVAALLMVSRFSYPHFSRHLRGRKQFQAVVQVVFVLAMIALSPSMAFFLLFWAYALSGPIRATIGHLRRHEAGEQHARTH